MVGIRGKRYGLDISGGRVRIVGRLFSSGRDFLDTFIDSYLELFDQEIIDTDAEFFFSIGEQDAIIKKVFVPEMENIEPNRLALFELTSSLIDDSDNYYLESHQTGIRNNRLAVAYNRELIDDKLTYLKAKIPKPTGFTLRSLAMVKAYNKFCKHEGGRLACLIDIDADAASYCFINDNRPLIPGHLGSNRGRVTSENPKPEIEQSFLVDLAATIKFRMMNLNGMLKAIPLSRIILTGYAADQELADRISKITGLDTVLPVINRDMLVGETNPECCKYLVPLGLTLDD